MQAEELPAAIDGVDISAGLPRVANNKKLYKRLLLQVADQAPATCEKLTAAVMSGDLNAVRESAHSLKGASGNLAITTVYESCEALETAAKSGDFPQVVIALDVLERALNAYAAAVAPLRA